MPRISTQVSFSKKLVALRENISRTKYTLKATILSGQDISAEMRNIKLKKVFQKTSFFLPSL